MAGLHAATKPYRKQTIPNAPRFSFSYTGIAFELRGRCDVKLSL
jgi:hypothetical protein